MFYLNQNGKIPETDCKLRSKIAWELTALCHTAAIVIVCQPVSRGQWAIDWCTSANRMALIVAPQIDLEGLSRLLETVLGIVGITLARPRIRDVKPSGNWRELMSGPELPDTLLSVYRVTLH